MRLFRIMGGAGAVLVAVWLQTSWFGHVQPLGVMPNVTLVVLVLFGLWSEASPTLAAAVGGGLMLDLASGSDFGLRTAFLTVLALAIVAGRQYGMQAGSVLTALVVVALGTLGYNAVVLATIRAPFDPIIFSRIGRELLCNEVLLLLLYLLRANLGRTGADSSFDLGAKVPQ